MTPEERNLINGLFDRLRTADSASKDREAEQLIQQKLSSQPSAPYLMAQTVLVQEQALNNAQARIKELEVKLSDAAKARPQETGGSFLSGLFGGKSASNAPAQPSAPPPLPASPQGVGGGYAPGAPAAPAPAAGGGFLRTALAAAAGVAGGSLLYQGLENMLGHHAGTFGSQMGGMGGNFMDTGYGGRPSEIIENREVVNNYYDNENRGHEGGGGGAGGDSISNTGDNDNGGDYSTPPHDDYVDTNDNTASADNGDYSSPPQDDPNDSSLFDSGSDSGSSYDDSGNNDNVV